MLVTFHAEVKIKDRIFNICTLKCPRTARTLLYIFLLCSCVIGDSEVKRAAGKFYQRNENKTQDINTVGLWDFLSSSIKVQFVRTLTFESHFQLVKNKIHKYSLDNKLKCAF